MSKYRKSYESEHSYSHNRRIAERLYNLDMLPLSAQYEYLAKVANKRLRSIEKIPEDSVYKEMRYYAYRNAQYDIKAMGADSHLFPSKAVENEQILRGRINAVKHFIESPSSTREGVREVYKKRADTINAKSGMEGKLTWMDLARYYESDVAQKAGSGFGSETRLKAIAVLKKKARNPKTISKAIAGDVRLSDSMAVDAAAKAMLRNGLDPSEIF